MSVETREILDRALKLPAVDKAYLVDELLTSLPAEERLKGLPVEERIKGLSAEELIRALPPETLEALVRKLKANGSSAKPQ